MLKNTRWGLRKCAPRFPWVGNALLVVALLLWALIMAIPSLFVRSKPHG